jgi:hypothetical protein
VRKSVVIGRKPRFYGGSLLKLQLKNRRPGTFSQSEEETPEGALCVSFVAILRARNVDARNLELAKNLFERSGGPGKHATEGSARRERLGACKGAWKLGQCCTFAATSTTVKEH